MCTENSYTNVCTSHVPHTLNTISFDKIVFVLNVIRYIYILFFPFITGMHVCTCACTRFNVDFNLFQLEFGLEKYPVRAITSQRII